MKQVFNYNSDSGHGWVAVPVTVLKELNIADKITGYSYISNNGKTAYLEEDLDAGTFLHAYVDRYKVNPKFKEFYQDRSHIRRLKHYSN